MLEDTLGPPNDLDQTAFLIMSSLQGITMTKDHGDPEAAQFLPYEEAFDALVPLTLANTLILRVYLPRREV